MKNSANTWSVFPALFCFGGCFVEAVVSATAAIGNVGIGVVLSDETDVIWAGAGSFGALSSVAASGTVLIGEQATSFD